MSAATRRVDLLVIGGGMAGLGAAARAAQRGASVLVAERGPAVGGSALYALFLWTAPSVEVMSEVNPQGDPELSAAVVAGYDDAIEWVGDLGVPLKDPVPLLGYGVGRETDTSALIAACEREVRERDENATLLSTSTRELLADDGRVTGAILDTPDGELRVEAGAVLLASGGYGGDADLRGERIHPLAAGIPVRANRWSRGDGLRLGLAAGAATRMPGAGFYGHLIPARIAYDEPHEFTMLTFYHSEHGVLLNLDGERFCDESEGDHLSTLAVLEQPEARALLVTDQRVHEEWMLTPYVEGVEALDKFALAYRRGARCATADSIEEFAELPDEWGYAGEAVHRSLIAFNEQAAAGAHDPPRRRDPAPLLDPPYYVIEVIPAITNTFEGLRVDVEGRVLDAVGEPITGLYAAGADAGGTYYRAYAGGLATALIQGLTAAESALARRDQPTTHQGA